MATDRGPRGFDRVMKDQEKLRLTKAAYVTGKDDLPAEFFRPCLTCFTEYKRAVGYFSATSFRSWGAAIAHLVDRPEVHIKLLISPELQPEDLPAAKTAVDAAGKKALLDSGVDAFMAKALLWEEGADLSEKDCADFLAWLIASEKMEIRIAFNQQDGRELGIFHSKIGIFSFPGGDKVAFTGSANESWSGHAVNVESIDVYRSWEAADTARLELKEEEFLHYWEGQSPQLIVLPLNEDTLSKVKIYSAKNLPRADDDQIDTPEEEIGLRPYQLEALEAFQTHSHGVLEMATGTGKTRVSLAILQWLFREQHVDSAIICMAGNDLLAQWEEDLWDLAASLGVGLKRSWGQMKEHQDYLLRPKGKMLLCSRHTFKTVFKQLEKMNLAGTMAIVHDEVHDLGSSSNVRDLAGHSAVFEYRLGLSATPERDYDESGNDFILNEIGPVIYEYGLEKAIQSGYLCGFDYYALPYSLTEEDKADKQAVYARENEAKKAGAPWTKEQRYRELARINKKAREKPSKFATFLKDHPEEEFLKNTIIFVEDKEFGERLYDTIMRHTTKYSQYFDTDKPAVLERFSKGDLDCLITCHKISQGIDIRSLKNVVLFSSQRGRRETIQRLGRCLRTDPDNPSKVARVIDFYESAPDGGPILDKIPDSEKLRSADADRYFWLDGLKDVRHIKR